MLASVEVWKHTLTNTVVVAVAVVVVGEEKNTQRNTNETAADII